MLFRFRFIRDIKCKYVVRSLTGKREIATIYAIATSSLTLKLARKFENNTHNYRKATFIEGDNVYAYSIQQKMKFK